jgi:hypothetical protein
MVVTIIAKQRLTWHRRTSKLNPGLNVHDVSGLAQIRASLSIASRR